MKFDEEFWNKLEEEIPGWMNRTEAEFLVDNLQGESYLELGVAYGKSLRFVTHDYKGSVDGIDKIDHGVHKKLEGANIIYGDSLKLKPGNCNEKIDTLFIDGDHEYEGCLGDFVHWYNYVAPGGRIIFHDYLRDSNHEGVTKTVDAIKSLLEDHAEANFIWAGTKPN